jgi:hypothetical protein
MADIQKTLYVNVGPNTQAQSALIYGINNNTPISFGNVVIGDTLFLTLYLVDNNALSSFSGDSNYTVKAAIGTPGTLVAALTENLVPSASAWSGSMSLNTLGVAQLLNSASYVNATFEVELTNIAAETASKHTILQVPVRVYNNVIDTAYLLSGSLGDYLTITEGDQRYWLRIETVDSASYSLTASYIENATPLLDGEDYHFPYYYTNSLSNTSPLQYSSSADSWPTFASWPK